MNWLTMLLWVVLCVLPSAPALADEKVVFRCDLDGAVAPGSSEGRLVTGYRGSQSLLVELAQPGTRGRRFAIAAGQLNDRFATLRAVVKPENVSEPPKPWNGIKVMLVLEMVDGSRQYPQIQMPVGTFDWKQMSQTIRLPKEIKAATLVVGLEAVSGRVWFDDLAVVVGRPARKGRRSETMFTGHDLPRLRGVMCGPRFKESDIEDLSAWNVNLIRWQLNWVPMKQAEEWARDLDAYDHWLDGALAECDEALAACEKHRIKVLVDLHTPPGGRANGGVCQMFQEKRYQDKLLEVWDKIARRYEGREAVDIS